MGSIKILLLGQCLHYGYDGVDRESTFPVLSRQMLASRFPSIEFSFRIKHFYHPLGLSALLRHRFLVSRPQITIVSAPAMFAARIWRVNLIYEMAPELVDTARSFVERIDSRVFKTASSRAASTSIDRLFAIRRPITLVDYEHCLEEAVKICEANGVRLILMGPGRFNEDTHESYEIHSPELWSAVNEMVVSLGERMKVPVIDAQEALAEYGGGEVFIPHNHRWSPYGHEVVAREVERVLSGQVMLMTGPSCIESRS